MRSKMVRFLLVFGIAGIYGILCRVLFALQETQEWLEIVSIAFIYTMPLSLGALVCFLGFRFDKPARFWVFGAPPIAMALILLGSLLFNIEAAICVLVAAPIVLPCALLGGWLMSLILRKREDQGQLQMTFFVLLPFVLAPMEKAWVAPHETRVMANSISIAAPAQKIWDQIYEVPAINREEIPGQWIYHLGFPRPVAAMIDKQGVGGKRHATFEGGCLFMKWCRIGSPRANCLLVSGRIQSSFQKRPLMNISSWEGVSTTCSTEPTRSSQWAMPGAFFIFRALIVCRPVSTGMQAGGASGSWIKSRVLFSR